MLIKIIKYSILLFLAGGIYTNLFAQIEIQTGTPTGDMVKMIVGEGVYFENVSYQGADIAKGTFNNGFSTNLGLNSGIILCTGYPNLIPGPNDDCDASGANGTPGHPLLDAILGSTTVDASVLEFDIIPETDTLKFRYVFGSEAYSEWVWSAFNDVFGIFITGPNPQGGFFSDKNIAIVPASDNTGISTSNINNGYAMCNIVPSGPCNNCDYFWDNTNGLSLQYDGFTTVLEAKVAVVPCETYHVLMGVADGSDPFDDSSVFIEVSSSNGPQVDVETNMIPQGISDNMVEGCVGTDITFKLPGVDYSPVNISLNLSGSTANPAAYPDGDFEEAIPTLLTFEEGVDSLTIHVNPYKDGIVEGDEILQIIIENTLGCGIKYDTIEFMINDYYDMILHTSPDTVICQGDELELWVNPNYGLPPYNLVWEGLPFTGDTITVSPDATTLFHMNVTDMCLETISDSIFVKIDNSLSGFSLGNDTTICTGNEIVLQAMGSSFDNYLWSTGDTTSSITVSQAGTYSLNVSNMCGESSDEIIVDQWPYPDPDLGPDLTLCFGETAFLEASAGFISYLWQDNSSQAFFSVGEGGLYYVNVEDLNGCTGSDSVFVIMGNTVDLPEDSIDLCEGDTLSIGANSGFQNYSWSTGEQTNSILVNEGGWYKVTASYSYGCPSEDSLFVDEYPFPEALISGDDMLCEGDTIWLQAPQGKFDYYWNDELTNSFSQMVTHGGVYTLTLSNVCGEDSQMKTIQLNPLPIVDLGEDKLLFPNESITLDAGQYQSYIWNDNPALNQQYYEVAYEDINKLDSIWVEVFDGFCKNTDSIVIEVLKIEVPNVITPNGDGLNDKFEPGDGWSGINKHTIKVFNRWGEVIWESNDFSSGWDAKRNGAYVADGTYFWILAVYLGPNNRKKIFKGTLTVLDAGE